MRLYRHPCLHQLMWTDKAPWAFRRIQTKRLDPALLRTFCQVYQATWNLICRSNIFVLRDLSNARQFLGGRTGVLSLHRYQVQALRHLEFTWDGEKPYKVNKRYRNRICLPELRTLGLIVRGYQGSQQGSWITNLTTLCVA